MMTIEQFGENLFKTNDLDPVYVALHRAALPHDQLRRLCLGYFAFYHLGVAAKLSMLSGRKFWNKMMEAAINEGEPKPWPRGGERRHFRGQQAVSAVASLASRYKTPEEALEAMFGPWPGKGYHLPFSAVSEAVQSHRGFGPWIAWKVADVGERVLGYPVDFSDASLGVYKDPRQGLALARFGDWQHPITDDEAAETARHYVEVFRRQKFKAPPHHDRLVNIQELETVACKWKSYTKGHYHIGKDIHEIREGLVGWGPVAEQLLEHMPPEVAGA